MVMLNDAQTGVAIPYASVWATITQGRQGRLRRAPVADDLAVHGPPLRQRRQLPGAGHYQLSLLVSPPVSARHVEYQNVWLKPHRVNVTFHWKPVVVSDASARPDGGLTRRRLLARRGRAGRRRRGRRASGLTGPGQRQDRAAGRARRPAAGPARAPARLDRDARNRRRRQPDRAALRPAAVLRRRWRAHAGLRAAARGRAADARARATGGALAGCCSPPAGGPATSSGLLGIAPPIPQAKGLSDFELPAIDDYDLCLHLACDDEQRLAAVEAALLHGEQLAGADGPLDISQRAALARDADRVRRRGPAGRAPERRRDPSRRRRCPAAAPLFMGFKSGCAATRPARTT